MMVSFLKILIVFLSMIWGYGLIIILTNVMDRNGISTSQMVTSGSNMAIIATLFVASIIAYKQAK